MLTADDLRFFSKVALAPSLAAVARELDVTPSAVTQRLKQVEERSGVLLIDRSARQLSLTNEGELVAARGRAILNDIDDLVDDLAARRDVIAGHLRIMAPLSFGRHHIAPVVAQFRGNHPEVTIDLSLSDRPIIATGENYDISIHIGELPDSGLVMRRLAPNRRFLCASPDYLARQGCPNTPDDLRRHACIAIRENNEDVTMWRLTRKGKTAHIRVKPTLASNDGEVARKWAIDGHGVLLRSEWHIAEALRSGELVQVMPQFTLPDADVVALLGHHRGSTARTIAFLNRLQQELKPPPWR